MTTASSLGVVAAAVQATPVFLDREATVERTCALVAEAAAHGAGLVVFPEAFIPGYPDWVWRSPAWDDFGLYDVLFDQAVDVPGPAVDRLREAAADAGVWMAVGVNERAAESSTLYNTLLYLSPDGRLAGIHRKLMATGGERTIWGQGDGSTLTVLDTPFGRLGGLICWENYMPLARAAMWAQRVDVFLAPTWDSSDTWMATLRHVAKEGRVHVVGTNTCMRSCDVPRGLPGAERLYGGDDWMSPGNAAIVGPDGVLLAGPLVGETGILFAELDVAAARRGRREFDPVGHYARPDVFSLVVDDRRMRPVSFCTVADRPRPQLEPAGTTQS
jgi:nitrilase